MSSPPDYDPTRRDAALRALNAPDHYDIGPVRQDSVFHLLALERAVDFRFSFFPTSIETNARANWQAQDTTVGTKPIFYANREPRRLTVNNLMLEGSEGNASVATHIALLFSLMDEVPNQGRPPFLLAVWGETSVRCVLEDVTVTEEFFRADGEPIRARVSLSLLQFQDEPRTDRGQPAPSPLYYRTTADGDIVAASDGEPPSGRGSGLPPR